MAVYVDDMQMQAKVGNLNARWSHLTADTEEELHAFAAKLGLKRAWFQPQKRLPDNEHNRQRNQVGKPRGRFHYDVTDSKRTAALELGAIPIGYGSTDRWMDLFSPGWREKE